jgi:tRNA threonylcarbamoyladenosine biosynthesis protein TsaB
MKILAIDTSTPSCSVAVVEGEHLLAELTFDIPQTHSRHLMGMIDQVLNLCALTPEEIDGLAVTRGPGSFTGLRIGLAVVKGLAAALDKPVVAVSTLHALASQAAFYPHVISPMIDARRGEVYCSRYRMENGVLRQIADEAVLSPSEALQGLQEPALFIGSGARAYHGLITEALGCEACFASSNANLIRAGNVAILALDNFIGQVHADLGEITPLYLRKSDAEINFGNR